MPNTIHSLVELSDLDLLTVHGRKILRVSYSEKCFEFPPKTPMPNTIHRLVESSDLDLLTVHGRKISLWKML